MAIITISRGSYSHGKEIAEEVARRLDYACISREILPEASEFFKVSEMKLAQSIHDAPNFMERVTHGRKRYLNYIQAALLEHVRSDNIVYHGFGGHLLLPRLTNILKIRIIAHMDERISFLRRKNPMSYEEAKNLLMREDLERARWNRYIFEKDMNSPELYDLVIHIDKLKISDACDIICRQAASDTFKATEESIRNLNDMAITSHIRAGLQDVSEAQVSTRNGIVHVKIRSPKIRKSSYASPDTEKYLEDDIRQYMVEEINRIAEKVPGVQDVICDVAPPDYH